MSKPDLKSAAVEFAKSHATYPAAVIQEAMEIAAGLVASAAAEDIRRNRKEMAIHRAQIERGEEHGWANGTLF